MAGMQGGSMTPAQPQLGRYCQWCGEPAIDEILIEPAQYRIVTKLNPISGEAIRAPEISRFAITADVCAAHYEIRDRAGGKPLPDLRRRKAEGVEQLDIFGGLTTDPAPARKPGNAIKGTQ